jgi:hypothetical protein
MYLTYPPERIHSDIVERQYRGEQEDRQGQNVHVRLLLNQKRVYVS